MSEPSVLTAIDDRIATLTLNRPARLNAVSESLCTDLLAALTKVDEDPDVRAVVITGAGQAFCAGGDMDAIARLAAASQSEARDIMRNSSRVIEKIAGLRKPTLAKVNGAAMGGGAALVLACDLAVAAAGASIGFVFGRIGIAPDMGTTALLQQAVGLRTARRLCLENAVLTAADARGLGLIERVVADGELDAAAAEIAGALAAAAPAAVAETKQLLHAAGTLPLGELLNQEADAQARLWQTNDVAEGLRAFAEKRTPNFTGR